MDFSGFSNNDFDFLKRKNIVVKSDTDNKEEVKRHFREFCYDIQKNYHSTTGGTLILDKDFQGINKNKNYIIARSKTKCMNLLELNITLFQDYVSISLVCTIDNELVKFENIKELFLINKDIFTKFFKENREMYIVVEKRGSKKVSSNYVGEDIKFENNLLTQGDYDQMIINMQKFLSSSNSKNTINIHIKAQFSKTEVIRMGKSLPVKACGIAAKLLLLCEHMK